MRPFGYVRPEHMEDALRHAAQAQVSFIAGGTNLVDLMKKDIARPLQLVDLTCLPLREVRPLDDGGLRVGALVSNADLAYHPEVARRYPLLSRAILAGASPQLRNMATTGGNLLQRTRCYYFYDVATPCNKREPGTGCPARSGLNRIHAILGASAQCVATHPSDMCVALAALAAVVQVQGPTGARAIPFAELHRLPGDTPHLDNNLAPGELVTAVDLPAQGFAEHHAYVKLRDRASYAFALVSVAAALTMEHGVITDARLALGGVAHKPWRSAPAEALLIGQRPDPRAFESAAEQLLAGAEPLQHNGFKLKLTRGAIVRALREASGAEQPS